MLKNSSIQLSVIIANINYNQFFVRTGANVTSQVTLSTKVVKDITAVNELLVQDN